MPHIGKYSTASSSVFPVPFYAKAHNMLFTSREQMVSLAQNLHDNAKGSMSDKGLKKFEEWLDSVKSQPVLGILGDEVCFGTTCRAQCLIFARRPGHRARYAGCSHVWTRCARVRGELKKVRCRLMHKEVSRLRLWAETGEWRSCLDSLDRV